MKQALVQIYQSDEELFENYENGGGIFPCSTPNLKYDSLQSRYFPTSEGLIYYGLDINRHTISFSPNKIDEFNKKVSRQFYEYIMNMDGADIDKIEFMIAKSISPTITNKYKVRHLIELAIYAQAEYYLKIGDRQTYGTSVDGDQQPIESNKRHFNNATHIAPAVHNYLLSLGMLYASDILILGYNSNNHKDW